MGNVWEGTVFRFTDLIILRTTRDCNLNCKYCFMKNKKDFKGEIIDFDLYKKIIDRIAEQQILNYVPGRKLHLVFHGGEVLMLGAERLYKMLEYASSVFTGSNLPHSFACQTNATLLNNDIAKTFQKFDVRVGLSFDGIDGANDFRTSIKQQAFEEKFALLEKNKLPRGFIVVAGKNNVDKLPESLSYLESLKIDEYKVNYAEDMDNPGRDSPIELSGKEMFEKVWKPELDKVVKGIPSSEFHIRNLYKKAIIDIISYHKDKLLYGCGAKYCGAGMSMIAIEPDGEMDLCDRYDRKYTEAYVQHALDYDFLGIHQIQKAMNYNYDKIPIFQDHKCDTCYANYICEYGCMSFHYSKYGKYGIDENLVCDQYKRIYDYVLEHLDDFLYQVVDSPSQEIGGMDEITGIKGSIIDRYKHYSFRISPDNMKIRITRQ